MMRARFGESQAEHDDLEHACIANFVELKERFDARAIAQAPPKYDSCRVSWHVKRIKQVKEESANFGDCHP